MLARSTYDQDYIDAQRTEAAAQLAAIRGAKISDASVRTAALENLVLRLELAFANRLRAAEGRDGNAMNEVRAIADSILRHGRVLTIERTIRLDAATSVLGIAPGGRVALDVAGVERLIEAYFDAIAGTYSPASLRDEDPAAHAPDQVDVADPVAELDAAEADGELLAVEDADVETSTIDAAVEVEGDELDSDDADADADADAGTDEPDAVVLDDEDGPARPGARPASA